MDTNPEIEDITFILENSVLKNQEDGSLYLLVANELLSSELPNNTYLHPKNVILFLDSLSSLKTICKDISELKFKILSVLSQGDTSTRSNN